MRRLLTIGLVLALAGLAVAQDAPRSIAAQRAITRHDQAMRKAEQEYQRAAVAAKRELIAELEQAKAQAMQAKQLDEANAIQAAIDTAEEELNRLLGKPQVQRFEIRADLGWQPTIEVRKGQRVEVRASGKWCAGTGNRDQFTSGPDGIRHPRTGEQAFYLEGQIGSQVLRLGSSRSFVAASDGVLEMRQAETGSRHDNDGSVNVSISLFP